MTNESLPYLLEELFYGCKNNPLKRLGIVTMNDKLKKILITKKFSIKDAMRFMSLNGQKEIFINSINKTYGQEKQNKKSEDFQKIISQKAGEESCCQNTQNVRKEKRMGRIN